MTIEIEAIKADREAGTEGPWSALNMVGDDGLPMTPEQIGEYVTNSLRMADESRFLFVSAQCPDGGACDVCHVGNGPRGPRNVRRIARVPEMEAALIEMAEALSFYADVSDYVAPLTGAMGKLWQDCGETARAVLSKHVGDG